MVAVSRDSDPKDPRLDDHAGEGALGLLRHTVQANKKQGVVVQGKPSFEPTVTKRTVNEVVILDCVDDSRWLQYTKDGALKNNVPGGHHRVDATVRHQHGRWVVEKLYVDEVGTC
ncbi:hypothetical protein ACQB60_10525 [Actinomycetota bacterium Odt1-20B]